MPSERLVIKVGTNVLTQTNQTLDYNVIHQIVEQVGELRRHSHTVVLVTSGAAGAAYGLADLSRERKWLVRRQMMTSLGQPRLMALYADFFREHGIQVGQALLTRADFGDRERYLNIRNVIEGLLQSGVLPIINENDVVATEALTFGDNDYLAAAVAPMIGANRLFLLTTATGFYLGGDPEATAEAKLVADVDKITQEMWDSCQESLSSGGRGGMLSKLKAAEMATSFGIETYIASGKEHNVVPRIMAGESIGTRLRATTKRLKSYRQWLRFGALTSGRVTVDEGAERALRNDKSLLPAGICEVQGTFSSGDVVEIFNKAQEKLGVGLINFSAEDLKDFLRSKPAAGKAQAHRRRGDHVLGDRTQTAIRKERMLLV